MMETPLVHDVSARIPPEVTSLARVRPGQGESGGAPVRYRPAAKPVEDRWETGETGRRVLNSEFEHRSSAASYFDHQPGAGGGGLSFDWKCLLRSLFQVFAGRPDFSGTTVDVLV